MVCNAAKYSIYFMNLDNFSLDWIFLEFNFTLIDIRNGLKYLGFIVKHNEYLKRDLAWMVSMIEGKLNLCCNKWLSRGGRLIMM